MNIDERELEIQKVLQGLLNSSITDIGDYGSICPFCGINCLWNTPSVRDIKEHSPDCIVPIAKDLTTGL